MEECEHAPEYFPYWKRFHWSTMSMSLFRRSFLENRQEFKSVVFETDREYRPKTVPNVGEFSRRWNRHGRSYSGFGPGCRYRQFLAGRPLHEIEPQCPHKTKQLHGLEIHSIR